MSERDPTDVGSDSLGDCEADVARMAWESPALSGVYPDQNPLLPLGRQKKISIEDEISRFESGGSPPLVVD